MLRYCSAAATSAIPPSLLPSLAHSLASLFVAAPASASSEVSLLRLSSTPARALAALQLAKERSTTDCADVPSARISLRSEESLRLKSEESSE